MSKSLSQKLSFNKSSNNTLWPQSQTALNSSSRFRHQRSFMKKNDGYQYQPLTKMVLYQLFQNQLTIDEISFISNQQDSSLIIHQRKKISEKVKENDFFSSEESFLQVQDLRDFLEIQEYHEQMKNWRESFNNQFKFIKYSNLNFNFFFNKKIIIKGRYQGQIRSFKPNGIGKFINYDTEEVIYGKWRNGQICGKGLTIYKDGSINYFEMKQGKLDGKYLRCCSNGKKIYKKYKKGIRNGKRIEEKDGKIISTKIYKKGILQ